MDMYTLTKIYERTDRGLNKHHPSVLREKNSQGITNIGLCMSHQELYTSHPRVVYESPESCVRVTRELCTSHPRVVYESPESCV